jgi:hypothetical protein
MNRCFVGCCLALCQLGAATLAAAATLEVGPGKPLTRIEDANAKAQPGDVILVYPQANNQPYEQTAVFVRQKNVTFRGVPAEGKQWVPISGKGFDYSGRGSTPRAIFQFNDGSDHCTLEKFELMHAHNSSHNGAGVRINQADRITVSNCSIHHNDMGIMSNGDGQGHYCKGVDQRIEHCVIHHNGDLADPGYNHNLYLGGTSVTVRFCEIHSSLTGHNFKSRAHHNRVEYCYIHDSANREFDLVDAADTARPQSHAALLGNVIVKHPQCPGNRGVIHFGQDGGKDHDGTLHLCFNTIVTPFIASVVELSAPNAKASLVGNIIADGGARQAGQKLAGAGRGAKLENVAGHGNWLAGSFTFEGTALDANLNRRERPAEAMFVDAAAHNFRLTATAAKGAAVAIDAEKLAIPAVPGSAAPEGKPLAFQYKHPAGYEKRPAPASGQTAGAYGHE